MADEMMCAGDIATDAQSLNCFTKDSMFPSISVQKMKFQARVQMAPGSSMMQLLKNPKERIDVNVGDKTTPYKETQILEFPSFHGRLYSTTGIYNQQ